MTHPIVLAELGRQRAEEVRRGSLRGGKRDTLMAALRDTPLFAFATTKDLRGIAKHAQHVRADAGKVLVREGDSGDRFFILLDGKVKVTRNGRKVADLGPGKGFGELALLLNAPRTATVTAAVPTELVAFDRKTFAKMLDESPSFARRLLEAIAKRLRECDAKSVQ
jgi:CRP/FNR family transcriptional regulator, cyclic AMP receptor protein